MPPLLAIMLLNIKHSYKKGGHWGDSGFARAKSTSKERLVINFHYIHFDNFRNMMKLKPQGFKFRKNINLT